MGGDGRHRIRGSFPVQRSVLSAPELERRLLARYALGRPVRCRLLSVGNSDTYLVEAGSTRNYLRVSWHAKRSLAEVNSEVALLLRLGRQGLRVPRPLVRRDGRIVTRIQAPEGARYAVLFAPVEGEPMRRDRDGECRRLGEWAGRFHEAVDRHRQTYVRPRRDEAGLLDAVLPDVARTVPHRRDVLAHLETLIGRLRPLLGALPRTPPDFGMCHLDLWTGNVRFRGREPPGVLDFDLCGYGWRAEDLSVLLKELYLTERDPARRTRSWNAYLRGYRQVRPLPARFDEAVPVLLAARDIWLMGLQSRELPLEYLNDRYFDGHVALQRRWIDDYPVLQA